MTGRVSRTESQVRKSLEELDLECVRFKLCYPSEGAGWSREKAQDVERHYKEFLLLNFLYPGKDIVPTKAMDEFWHQHILDTEKYAEDCENVFGYFLHHFPYFGMGSKEAKERLDHAHEETRQLWQEIFGEPLPSRKKFADCDDGGSESNCPSSCSGQMKIRPRFDDPRFRRAA